MLIVIIKSRGKDVADVSNNQTGNTIQTGGSNSSARLLKNKNFLIMLVVLVLVIVGAVYATRHYNNSSSWGNYTAQKYGFKFSYLKSWGEPKVVAAKLDPSKSDSPVTAYFISFNKNNDNSSALYQTGGITIAMQPGNYFPKPICDSDNVCHTIEVLTDDKIKSSLAKGSSDFVTQGKDYYAIIYTDPANHLASELDIYKIVSLPKIYVTAARLTESNFAPLSPKIDCPDTKFAPTGTKDCISEQDYQTAFKFLDSLKEAK